MDRVDCLAGQLQISKVRSIRSAIEIFGSNRRRVKLKLRQDELSRGVFAMISETGSVATIPILRITIRCPNII